MELFGYASLINVGLLLGMMGGGPSASRYFKFSTTSCNLFHLQHTDSSPKPVFGLAVACADRVQRATGMRGPRRPGSAVGKTHLEKRCRLDVIHKFDNLKELI